MGLLPDIEGGKLVPEKPLIFTPKNTIFRRGTSDEALLLGELNNFDREYICDICWFKTDSAAGLEDHKQVMHQ